MNKNEISEIAHQLVDIRSTFEVLKVQNQKETEILERLEPRLAGLEHRFDRIVKENKKEN